MTKGYSTAPAGARLAEEPEWLWRHEPPLRYRRNTFTAWPEITITEGRNRQVRRMAATVGHPTLRLVRVSIGAWSLQLQPVAGLTVRVYLRCQFWRNP